MRGRYGAWLKLRRNEQHISQARLAELANVDRTYLVKIERGNVLPGREIRDRINSALGIDPDDIGYLRSLPSHERAVAQLAFEEESLTTGQLLDRIILFASGRERDMIVEFVHILERIIMADDEEGVS